MTPKESILQALAQADDDHATEILRDAAKALINRRKPNADVFGATGGRVHAERVTLAKLPQGAKEKTVPLFRRPLATQGAAAGCPRG
jgi:hypothetical protein